MSAAASDGVPVPSSFVASRKLAPASHLVDIILRSGLGLLPSMSCTDIDSPAISTCRSCWQRENIHVLQLEHAASLTQHHQLFKPSKHVSLTMARMD